MYKYDLSVFEFFTLFMETKLMNTKTIFRYMADISVFLLLLAAGCSQTIEEPSTIALKYTVGGSSTYKVVVQAEKNLELLGFSPDSTGPKGGSNLKKLEMTFTKQITSTDVQGNAIAKITIKEFKYFSEVKGNTEIDFDSSREKDLNSPLAKLIGKSYTLRFSPTGEVLKAFDLQKAKAALRGGTKAHKIGLGLLALNSIKQRHGFVTLPQKEKKLLASGDSWSTIKTFDFGLMGPKEYEKIYTLNNIKKRGGSQIAEVQMKAIPSSEMSEQLYKEGKTSTFTNMFENSTETYTGRLQLDLTEGKINKCSEELRLAWDVSDPGFNQEDDTEPRSVKTSVVRINSIEKID